MRSPEEQDHERRVYRPFRRESLRTTLRAEADDGGILMGELLADYGQEAKSGEVLNALARQQITRFSPEVAATLLKLAKRFSDRMQEPTTYASRPGPEPA